MAETLSLFCVVEGQPLSEAFKITIPLTADVADLRVAIKAEKAITFFDVDADTIILWSVSIPNEDDDDEPIMLVNVPEKKKLRGASKLSKVFPKKPSDEMIHIIVQPPSLQGNADAFRFL